MPASTKLRALPEFPELYPEMNDQLRRSLNRPVRRIPGYNVDRINIGAGLRELAACGYDEPETVMVIEYALARWARGEEEAAQRGAIDREFHGINLISWMRVLAAAQATAAAAAAHEKSRKGRRTDAAPKKSSQGQAFDGRSLRKRVTAAGRAELAPPHIFDDLFKKEKLMLTNAEIDAHPLLDRDQRVTCKARRNLAKKEHRPFTMLEFAEVSLRETGNDYAALTDQGGLWAAWSDDALRRAAILYVYEAVKAGPPIVAETAGERGTLRDIELLASHGVTK